MKNKFILVLGASGGIGEKIAEDLAQEGFDLYLQYHNSAKKIDALKAKLTKEYPEQIFSTINIDLRSSEDTIKKSHSISELYGIVIASGITDYDLLVDERNEKISELFQVNVISPILLIKQLERLLSANEFSRIVFIGSVYGRNGSAVEAVYSSTKGAIASFTSAYAKEVASLGLTVNVIAPGAISTEMTRKYIDQNLIEDIPMQRIGTTKDISFWVNTLIDERSQYFTGETIYVTGGW